MIGYEGDDYHRKRHPEFIASEELRVAWSCFANLAYFANVRTGDEVLEYGGGLGANLLTVCKRAETWMLEPSQIGRNLAEQAGIKVVGDIHEIGSKKFDAILCRHVLEHVDNPLGTLLEILSVLKPGGELIVVVPCENMRAFPIENDINHHLYCWNPRALSNLLSKAGFRVTKIRNEYFGAKRVLLPVFRLLGGRNYASLVRLVGRIFRFKELVIEAIPEQCGRALSV